MSFRGSWHSFKHLISAPFCSAKNHSTCIRRVSFKQLLSSMFNWLKLVYEPFGRCKMHHNTLFLSRPVTKESNVPMLNMYIVAKSLLSWYMLCKKPIMTMFQLHYLWCIFSDCLAHKLHSNQTNKSILVNKWVCKIDSVL